MKHWKWGAVCALVGTAACDSPTQPRSDVDLAAPAPQVAQFLPAIDDVRSRILPSGGDTHRMLHMQVCMNGLRTELMARDALAAQAQIEYGRSLLSTCDAECLAPADRSVIELTLDHAAMLIGIERRLDILSPVRDADHELTGDYNADR